MLLTIAFATFLALLIGWLILRNSSKKRTKKVYFVGPHCSGKTLSIAKLMNIPNKTVTTLSDSRVLINSTEVIECVQNDFTQDFVSKFHINSLDRFIFFVKNEEEMRLFPDLSGFDVKFVMWKKTEQKKESEKNPNIIYLQESVDKLIPLIK